MPSLRRWFLQGGGAASPRQRSAGAPTHTRQSARTKQQKGYPMTRQITVTHDGVTYYGHVATITGTFFGYEDHGILTAGFGLSWDGSGVGCWPQYCLDETTGSPTYDRRGTSFGLDHVMQLMKVVGVSSWEKVKGSKVIVLFETESPWGGSPVGYAHIDDNRVFFPAEHAVAWRADAEVSA